MINYNNNTLNSKENRISNKYNNNILLDNKNNENDKNQIDATIEVDIKKERTYQYDNALNNKINIAKVINQFENIKNSVETNKIIKKETIENDIILEDLSE